MLIIGSFAAHQADAYLKDPQDLDLVGSFHEYNQLVKMCKAQDDLVSAVPISESRFVIRTKTGLMTFGLTIIEFEMAWEDGSSADHLLEVVKKHQLSTPIDSPYHTAHGLEFEFASLPVLYALKMSHRYLRNNPYFEKTMRHIRVLRAHLGSNEIDPRLKEWFAHREKDTYFYKHPKLNQAKNDFFKDDNVPYKYDHDTLHLAVKKFDRPAYEYFKEDQAQVFCSKDKFNSLSEEMKLSAVLEESYVLALERSLIPNDFKPNPFVAFKTALEKVCTSITSGWFREYAWENYEKVMEMADVTYVLDFHQGVQDGVVKEIEGDNQRSY